MTFPGHLLLNSATAVALLLLLLLLNIPSFCHGFAAPNTRSSTVPPSTPSTGKQDLVSKLQNQLTSFQKPKKAGQNDNDSNRPQSILDELDLQSSTEPKTFGFLAKQIPDLLTASFPAVMRLGSGVFADGYRISLVPKDESRYTILSLLGDKFQVQESSNLQFSKQNLPLVIYEFEGCPFCRKVREAVSILSLEVTFRPCPQGRSVFRQDIKTNYGKSASFPFLMDPNTGVQMFESDDIINYLFRVYGKNKGKIPWTLSSSPLVPLSAGIGLLPRLGKGNRYRTSNPPSTPVVFWSYEGSPFCKIVKERLVELGIPHTQISCPRGSFNRDRLLKKTGRFQVPYLEDPNTRVNLFESAAIMEYLDKVYGIPEPKVKYL